jgi:hypothetical protein
LAQRDFSAEDHGLGFQAGAMFHAKGSSRVE